jgi:hypothetical protein
MRTNTPKVLGLDRRRHMLNLAETYERAAVSVWFVQQLQCPLYPQKRTCAVQELMSALGQ